MKKNLIAILGLTLLTGAVVVNTVDLNTQTAEATLVDSGFAEYVSVENAPIIDGVIDDVWLSAKDIETAVSGQYANGVINILWNETGLYFLANIVDTTVNVSDRCNLWVSEKYISSDYVHSDWVSGDFIAGTSGNGDLTYPKVDGAWFLCLNPNGDNQEYTPDSFGGQVLDMTGKYTVATTKTAVGYIVEVYVLRIGATPLKEGNSIGFEVSIDDYFTKGTSINDRKSYVNWKGLGAYWENPACLGEVVLVDEDESNGSPIKQDDDNNDESSLNNQVTDNNSSMENNSTTDSEGKQGCSSSMICEPIAFVVVLSSISLMKKKKY